MTPLFLYRWLAADEHVLYTVSFEMKIVLGFVCYLVNKKRSNFISVERGNYLRFFEKALIDKFQQAKLSNLFELL